MLERTVPSTEIKMPTGRGRELLAGVLRTEGELNVVPWGRGVGWGMWGEVRGWRARSGGAPEAPVCGGGARRDLPRPFGASGEWWVGGEGSDPPGLARSEGPARRGVLGLKEPSSLRHCCPLLPRVPTPRLERRAYAGSVQSPRPHGRRRRRRGSPTPRFPGTDRPLRLAPVRGPRQPSPARPRPTSDLTEGVRVSTKRQGCGDSPPRTDVGPLGASVAGGMATNRLPSGRPVSVSRRAWGGVPPRLPGGWAGAYLRHWEIGPQRSQIHPIPWTCQD